MSSPVTIEYAGKNKNKNSHSNEKNGNSMVHSSQSGKTSPPSISYATEYSLVTSTLLIHSSY